MNKDTHLIYEGYINMLASKKHVSNKGENEEDKDDEGELMTHMKQKGMIPKNASIDTGKYGHSREEEEGYTAKDYADEMERKGEGQKIKHKDESEEHCKYAAQGCTCHGCPECKKNFEEEEAGHDESQETIKDYEDAEVEFDHNGIQYIAFGNGLYNENDDDYDIEDFKVYKRENLNNEVEEEDQNIRNIAYNNLYNKIINMSAEDNPHPSLSDPSNYLPRQ